MLEQLFEFLGNSAERLRVFTILQPYEEGVLTRKGLYLRNLGPGWHWLIPVIDHTITDNVVPRTVNLQAQSLTTKDGRSVVVGGVVTCYIRNIKKATLGVEGVDDALRDSCLGCIAEYVESHTWDELRDPTKLEELADDCQQLAGEYGIKIERVRLSDKALMRALRVHMDQTNTFKD